MKNESGVAAYIDKLKDAEEQEEAKHARKLTKEQRAGHVAFLRRWTQNGKHLITNAGGNFWMRGGNRSRCTILRPVDLVQLVNAGILDKVPGGYRFNNAEGK